MGGVGFGRPLSLSGNEMKLVAKKHFKYNGVFYAPGDEFEAGGQWGDILLRIGNAELAKVKVEKSLKPAKAANKKGGYNRRDVSKTETK